MSSLVSQFEQAVIRFKRMAFLHEVRTINGTLYSRTQLEVLSRLIESSVSTTSQLAKELFVSSGAITQTIDSLIRRELVYKAQDSRDRRVNHIYATDQGGEVVAAYQKQQRQVVERWLGGLGEKEAEILISALEKLTDMATKDEPLSGGRPDGKK